MKIRTDFVTNSSSSSYVTVKLKSNMIAKILEKHKEEIRSYFSEGNDFYDGVFTINENNVELNQGYPEIGLGEFVPTSKEDVVSSLAQLLTWGDVSDKSDLTEYKSDDLFFELLSELFDENDRIVESLEEINWIGENQRYGEYSDEPGVMREFVYSAESGEKYTETETESEDFDEAWDEF